MNEPRLRFKEFKEDWEKNEIKDIFLRQDNLRRPIYKQERLKGNTPYYGANGIQDYVSGYTCNGSYLLIAEDLFVPSSSSNNFTYGNIITNYPIFIINEKAWINNHIHVLKPKNKISLYFAKYEIKKLNIRPYLVGIQGLKLRSNDLMNINIEIPSYDEQQKIGSFFEKLDKLIQLQSNKLEHLKITKKGYLQKILENKFNNNKNNWKTSKLKKLVNIQTGKLDANAMTPHGKYDFYTSGKKVYKINSYIFDGNAITIAGNGSNVGFMHLAMGKFNAYQRTYVLNNFQIDWIYIFFIIKVKMRKLIYNNSRNGNIPYIVLGDLQNLNIEYPNINEQEKIGRFFSNLDQQITLQQQKLNNLKQQKKAYLQKMFI